MITSIIYLVVVHTTTLEIWHESYENFVWKNRKIASVNSFFTFWINFFGKRLSNITLVK